MARLHRELTLIASAAPPTRATVQACAERAFIDQDAALWGACRDTPGLASSGTCAAVVAVHAPTGRAWSAHVGDVRVVVFERRRSPGRRALLFHTKDHKPADERRRIEKADGVVTTSARVNGYLAVSRALGNFHRGLKRNRAGLVDHRNAPVSALPTVSEIVLPAAADCTVLVACDGVWDVMTSADAVRSFVDCRQLVHRALELRSADNVSALAFDIVVV